MKGETMQIPKQQYTSEFKRLAVTRVKDGLTAGAAAKELGLVEQTLRNWVKAAAAGTLNGAGAKVVTPEQMELSRLRAVNVRLTRENDILKKATVSSGDQRNTNWGTVELEGDRDGTHGASGLVCGPESGPVAAMETGAIVERDRPGTRQARGIDSWRGVLERRVHSCRS
jgi:transposase